ncbi:MAG: YdcF family protein [Gemmiger sp.]|nr:YdcF family protein [Gemmiger sp.]
MLFLIAGLLALLAFVLSTRQEPRRFCNAMLLAGGLVLLLVGFAALTNQSERVQTFLCIVVFILVPVTLAFMAILLIINGFVMLKREGAGLRHLLSLFVGAAVLGGLGVTLLLLLAANLSMASFFSLWLGAMLMGYFTFTFLALLLYSWLYTLLPKNITCDYIIVHGCGLLGGKTVPPLLRGRVDKAVEVYRKGGGRAKLVLSGGQGADEEISEAAAMENYLLATGFPPNALLLEDKSATTYENLRNVRDMLDGNGAKHRYIFVTNDYHIFRTALFARKLGMKASGVGCKTSLYYWPSAFIREYIAVMMQFQWTILPVLLVWLVGFINSLLPFNL